MGGRRELALRKREGRIVRQARRLFLKRGFEQSTVLEIAKASDVAIGTIYKHFDSKEAILVGVLEHQMRRLMRAVLRAVQACEDPLDRLRIFTTLKGHLVAQNRPLFERDLRTLSILVGAHLPSFETSERQQQRFLTALAEDLIKAGQLKPGCVKLYAQIMGALSDSYIQAHLSESKPFHQSGEAVCQMLLQGAGTPS